jgi:uncharacterized membrane protein YjjB (DUF3815 family)
MSKELIQVFMGMTGSLGFAILYHIRGRKLLAITLGGGLGWVVYLVCRYLETGLNLALFWGTFCVAALSAVLARLMHAPVLLFLIPMTIPMIPGSDLYYAMEALVKKLPDVVALVEKVSGEAFSMAMGIVVSSGVIRLKTGRKGMQNESI